MALASEWVARIFAISMVMILPGVGGQWLDTRLGTGFLALVGFALGFCIGFGVLLVTVKSKAPRSMRTAAGSGSEDQGNGNSGDR